MTYERYYFVCFLKLDCEFNFAVLVSDNINLIVSYLPVMNCITAISCTLLGTTMDYSHYN